MGSTFKVGRVAALGVAIGVMSVGVPPSAIDAASQSNAPVTITVTRDGRPVQRATVVIRVLPPQDTWEAASEGVPLDMPVVATGVSDGKGRVHITPANVVDRANADGEANFVAVIAAGGESVTWTFPLQVKSDVARAEQQDRGELTDHRLVDLRIDVGAEPGAADMQDPPQKWSELGTDRLTSTGLLRVEKSTAPDGGVTPNQYCYYYWTDWKYSINMPIGDLWSWSGAKMSQTYDTSVTSTLGTAFQTSGGTMSASGTVSFAVTSGAGGSAGNLYNNRTYNQINYRKLTDSCFLSGTWYPYNTVNILYPIYGVSPHPNWESSFCGTYASPQVMHKTQGSNVTFGAGINLGPISVSTHTDWKTDNKLSWNFGPVPSRLCGSNGSQGWVSSPRAEAHQQ